MSVTHVSDKKYTTETIARAFKYFALYRAAYNRPREDPELPSVRTFTGLISKVKTTDNSSYVTQIFTNLNDIRQRNNLLLFDEVYVKATVCGIVFKKLVNQVHLTSSS